MSTRVEITYSEFPVFFDALDARLFAIVTLPVGRPPHTGFVILPGAGTPFTVNRNRLSVRLARGLAPLGYAVMRCDYHGAGDSTGTIERFHLGQPFIDDVAAAVTRLRLLGVRRVIIAGSCFGGRSALSAAATLEDVDAVVLLATSLRDYERGERKPLDAATSWSTARFLKEALRPRRLRGLLDPRARQRYGRYARAKLRTITVTDQVARDAVSPTYEQPLRTLVDRRVPILQVFGDDDSSYEEYRAAIGGPLADVAEAAGERLRTITIPGKIHGFLTPPIQDEVVRTLVRWASERLAVGEVTVAAAADEP